MSGYNITTCMVWIQLLLITGANDIHANYLPVWYVALISLVFSHSMGTANINPQLKYMAFLCWPPIEWIMSSKWVNFLMIQAINVNRLLRRVFFFTLYNSWIHSRVFSDICMVQNNKFCSYFNYIFLLIYQPPFQYFCRYPTGIVFFL